MLTKVDLLPHLPQFSVAAVEDALARVMPSPRLIKLSAITGEGVGRWLDWLSAMRADHAERGTRSAE